MRKLFFDIETIPTQDERVKADIAASIHAPANYKKQEAIEKWYAENEEAEFDKAYRKTSFNGLVNEIVCISFAFDDEPVQHVHRRSSNDSESALIIDFGLRLRQGLEQPHTDLLDSVQWIGHYITGFDLPVLWQRHIMLKVIPIVTIPYNAKPWDRNIYDTKMELCGSRSTGYGSLDEISKLMGHKPKGDITGATVWDAWLAGRGDDIAEYCDDDVERVRDLHKRMTFA